MSVLQVYLSWANSLLCEVNRGVDSVADIQEGRVLCELIDILAPEAALLDKVKATGPGRQRAYIHCALDHMKSHGIKIVFSTQDIMDGDIKSLLDVMWLLILNYSIHFIGENSFQRTVGVGKKALLEWCQGELDVTFDPKDTLATNLCAGNWFTKLLQIFAGSHIEEAQDKVSHLQKMLQEIEERYGIRRNIISSNDIVDGTVDEHTLMIYVALLKRRVCSTARSARREMLSVDGKEAALARVEERFRSVSAEVENRRRYSEQIAMHKQLLEQNDDDDHHHHQEQEEQQGQSQEDGQQPQQASGRSSRALSLDSSLALPQEHLQARSQESLESNWWSSESNSQPSSSGQDRPSGERRSSLVREAEQVLLQTISEKVHETLSGSEPEEDKDTDRSQGHSEKEAETASELSSGAFDEGYSTLRNEPSQSKNVSESLKDTDQAQSQSAGREDAESAARSKNKKPAEKPVEIKISRPKDYYLQWEETIDRLSHAPPDAPDVSDMSPRSPRQILRGVTQSRSPRSRSESDDQEVYGEPVWKRREYFERPGTSTSDSRGLNRLARSISAPTRAVNSRTYLSRSSESRQKARSGGIAEDNRNRQRGHSRPKDSTLNSQDNNRQELSAQANSFRSDFMNTLEELQRSGKAKKVILPELGQDTPVVMVPAQGKDVLLLFDALRQGAAAGETTNDTNGRKSPVRTSPTQQSEDTEVKDAGQKADSSSTGSAGSREGEEGEDTVCSLPRPTAHKHRVPKPLDIRVADLRSGKSRDVRRTQSLTERKSLSPLAAASASSRFQSLSPRREQSVTSPSDNRESSNRSPLDANETSQTPVSLRLADSVEDVNNRGSLQGSNGFRQAAQKSSLYTSPYRPIGHHALSPRRPVSPRHSPGVVRTVERPPPLELPADLVSPRPRAGGLGRVPRKEAWERQLRKRESQALDNGGTESTAQTRFIQVLSKEIEELKQKIEVMEDSQADSSLERGSLKRGWRTATPTSTGKNDTFFTSQSEIRETDSRMVLARKDATSPGSAAHRSWQSPRHWDTSRYTSSPRRYSPRFRPVHTSLSPNRSYTNPSSFTTTLGTSPHRQSPSPRRCGTSVVSPRPGPIALGYTSPIRSVTQEIWGQDLGDGDNPQADHRDKYRKLISQTSLSEKEVIELKQALASSVVENDILQAKLRNARYEIQDKLNKTNEVLDDCRRHLARSQAENMELRTALERERDRANKSEAYVQDLRQMAQQARADKQEVEEELQSTLNRLDQSKPGLEALQNHNHKLRGQATFVQSQNSSLKKEVEELRKSQSRSANTIRELRHLLEQARGERDSLQQQQQQQSRLQRTQSESSSKVQVQVRTTPSSSHYQEKGARDEAEKETVPNTVGDGGYSATSSASYSSQKSLSHLSVTRRSRSLTEVSESASASTRSIIHASATPNDVSATTFHPRAASPPRGLSYRYCDVSPVLPSTYREIYPHRKPRQQGPSWDTYSSPERHDSPVTFIDYPDLQHYPTRLDPLGPAPHTHHHHHHHRHPYTTTSSSRDTSPIYKPIPYRPYPSDPYTSSSSSLYPKEDTTTTMTAKENHRGPRSTPLGMSPVRTPPPTVKGSRSASSSPGPSGDRLLARGGQDFSPLLYHHRGGPPRSASCSPGRGEDWGRRGILKKGGSSSREGTPSPRCFGSRSHSPPTRLSPEPIRKKLLTFTPASEKRGVTRGGLSYHQDRPGLGEELRQKHSSMSWLHLQFPPPTTPTDRPAGLQTVGPPHPGLFSRDEHLLLSEEQRQYANTLIRKYTGINP
ncbi:uncharacterized protein LOC143292661 [Babylonia areolata]|uniref:uncharacterized protein LOC143292661 n=1 Tax=Babylonia areolata TaxID=304850 RepID=UPI003FD54AAF